MNSSLSVGQLSIISIYPPRGRQWSYNNAHPRYARHSLKISPFSQNVPSKTTSCLAIIHSSMRPILFCNRRLLNPPSETAITFFLEIHEHRVSDVSRVASCIKRQHTSFPRIALFMVSCIATMCAITYILNFVVPQYLFHRLSRLTHASIITFFLVHPPLCNTLPRHSNIRTCQSFSANRSGFFSVSYSSLYRKFFFSLLCR